MADIPKQKKEKKQKFHLPLSAWLSYLVIATLLLSSITLARYTTSTTDSNGARVAKFEVSANPDENDGQANKIMLSTTELNTETYAFSVRNTSEVVVNYKIIVTNVPGDIDVSINDSEFSSPDENGTVAYTADHMLGINAEKECTVAFKAHDQYTAVQKYEEKMKVEVRFDQVD